MSREFLLTTLVVVVTPGTGVLYTVAAGLSRGARASVVAAVGCTLGIVPHVAAAITGLAALLHTSPSPSRSSAPSASPTCCTWRGARGGRPVRRPPTSLPPPTRRIA
jgi:hypothetical protein